MIILLVMLLHYLLLLTIAISNAAITVMILLYNQQVIADTRSANNPMTSAIMQVYLSLSTSQLCNNSNNGAKDTTTYNIFDNILQRDNNNDNVKFTSGNKDIKLILLVVFVLIIDNRSFF